MTEQDGKLLANIEQELAQRVRARTVSMKWRPNYEDWVRERIWQERYREPALQNLKHYFPHYRQSVILDLGSGMGGLLIRLQQEGLHVLGVDLCFMF